MANNLEELRQAACVAETNLGDRGLDVEVSETKYNNALYAFQNHSVTGDLDGDEFLKLSRDLADAFRMLHQAKKNYAEARANYDQCQTLYHDAKYGASPK